MDRRAFVVHRETMSARDTSDVRCREDETRERDAREMTRGFSMDGWIKRDDEDDRAK